MSTAEPIDYEAVLADLRSRRDQLNAAIAGIERFLGVLSSAADAAGGLDNGPSGAERGGRAAATDEPLPKQVGPDTFFRLSAVEAAKKYLRIVKQPASMKAIEDAIKAGGYLTNSKNFYANLYTAIMRAQDFVKVGKKWGLAEWYPGRRPPESREAVSARKRKKKGQRSAAKVKGAVAAEPTAKPKRQPRVSAERAPEPEKAPPEKPLPSA